MTTSPYPLNKSWSVSSVVDHDKFETWQTHWLAGEEAPPPLPVSSVRLRACTASSSALRSSTMDPLGMRMELLCESPRSLILRYVPAWFSFTST